MAATVAKQLHDLGNGVYAYTQLPGSWGWSNAGLITDGGESLLIDTLFDETITAEMLQSMRRATPAASRIGTVVNTHGNGDHCYGNSLVANAEIIATPGCVEDLREGTPKRTLLLLRAGAFISALGAGGRLIGRALNAAGFDRVLLLSEASSLALPKLGQFDFAGVDLTLPSRTFEGELELHVGDKNVVLIEVGPAHTLGDAVVWVPDDKTLFTGDILFKDAHPVIWQGPVSNWIAALRRLLDMDIDTVVPGHGPLTDKAGLSEQLHYLEVVTAETRARYDAGMTVEEAAHDLILDEFSGWIDAERLYVNVHTLYRDFDGDPTPGDVLELFAGMGRLHKTRR